MVKILLVILLFIVANCCHYSCATCYLGESFVNCTACNNGNLTKLFDPDEGNTQNFFYHRFTGVCEQPLNAPFNILGILLLVFTAGAFVFTHKR